MNIFYRIKMFFHKIYFYFCLYFYEHSETIRDIAWVDNLKEMEELRKKEKNRNLDEIFEVDIVVSPKKEYEIEAEIEEIEEAEPCISEEDFKYINKEEIED